MKTEWLIFSYPLRSCAICTFLDTTVFDHSLVCSSVGTTILAESPVQYISVERQLTYIKPCLRGGILFFWIDAKKSPKNYVRFFFEKIENILERAFRPAAMVAVVAQDAPQKATRRFKGNLRQGESVLEGFTSQKFYFSEHFV